MNAKSSVCRFSFGARIACAAAVVLTGAVALAENTPAYDAEKFMAEKAPTLVTIKFNLRGPGGENDEQSESEITGVTIDPKGLILCSNMQLTGMASMFSGMGRSDAMPTNIRVLIGDDAQGVKAKLLARDSELDLAWVQLNDPPSAPLPSIDLTKAVKPRIGQQTVCLHRLGKYFDRVPAIREVRISALTRKPRELYMLGGSLNVDFGLPVFATSGEVIGIMILPVSDEAGEEIRQNPFAMLGGLSGILDLISGAVLPAQEVVRATQRARENPQSQPADAPEARQPTTRPGADADQDRPDADEAVKNNAKNTTPEDGDDK